MTCEAGKQGEGVAPATPRPGSAMAAAMAALDWFGYEVIANMPGGIGRRRVLELAADALSSFAEEQRLVGAMKAHDSFDGILTEHALALEEARDELREAFCIKVDPALIIAALKKLDEQITYVRALGSVVATEEDAQA